MISRALRIHSIGEFYDRVRIRDDEVLVITVGETLGSVAGKVVAAAKRTATSLSDEKDRLSSSLGEDKKKPGKVATRVRSDARSAVKKAKKKTQSAKKSVKRAVSSVKSKARFREALGKTRGSAAQTPLIFSTSPVSLVAQRNQAPVNRFGFPPGKIFALKNPF